MKKLYLLWLVWIIALSGKTQTFEWLKTVPIDYEFNPGMIQYSTCTDPEGNIYFFGLQEHLIFYNQAMGNQFLKKYNPDGELIWEKIVTGEGLATGIYCDNTGGIYVYGQFHSDLDFWGELTLYFVDINTNGFLVKLNYQGEIDWGTNLEDLPMESGTISDVSSDNSGLLVAGYSTWINSYILKFNTDGDYTGSILQEDVSLVSGVDVDNDGDIYASGGCAGFNSMFGGVSYPAPFAYSSYIVKYNSNDEPEWVKFIEDITCSQIKVRCDNSGSIYVAGQIIAETTLDTIVVHGASWVYDFFLTRLNADGEFQWVIECPEVLTGDATVGPLQFLSTDLQGNALIAGFTRGTIDWGNGIVSNTGNLYYSVIVLNISPDGIINWVKTAGGEGYDDSHSICAGPEGDVYIAGIAGGTSVFDTITYVTDDFVYPFLAKLDIPALTSLTDNVVDLSSFIYPNPASAEIYIRAEAEESFVIFNSRGEKMKEGLITGNNHRVDVNDLASGIYFILLKQDNKAGIRNSKFIIK
jgi:hypothetical protein